MWWKWGLQCWRGVREIVSGNDWLSGGSLVLVVFCLFLSVCMSGLFDGVKVSV